MQRGFQQNPSGVEARPQRRGRSRRECFSRTRVGLKRSRLDAAIQEAEGFSRTRVGLKHEHLRHLLTHALVSAEPEWG